MTSKKIPDDVYDAVVMDEVGEHVKNRIAADWAHLLEGSLSGISMIRSSIKDAGIVDAKAIEQPEAILAFINDRVNNWLFTSDTPELTLTFNSKLKETRHVVKKLLENSKQDVAALIEPYVKNLDPKDFAVAAMKIYTELLVHLLYTIKTDIVPVYTLINAELKLQTSRDTALENMRHIKATCIHSWEKTLKLLESGATEGIVNHKRADAVMKTMKVRYKHLVDEGLDPSAAFMDAVSLLSHKIRAYKDKHGDTNPDALDDEDNGKTFDFG